MPILLATGFGLWDGHRKNASREMLQGIDPVLPRGWHIRIAEIPVAWAEAPVCLDDLLANDVSVAVLFGQGSFDSIRVERIAVNLADRNLVDAQGRRHEGAVIDPEGPPAYWTRLPWRAILGALDDAGIPSAESDDAGRFLCNYSFYHLMRYINSDRDRLSGGFVHVPRLEEMPLTTLKRAAELILSTVVFREEKSRREREGAD